MKEPGICEIGRVTVFEVLLCQHLAALIVIFIACNYDVHGVSATGNILRERTSFISESCGVFKWLTKH